MCSPLDKEKENAALSFFFFFFYCVPVTVSGRSFRASEAQSFIYEKMWYLMKSLCNDNLHMMYFRFPLISLYSGLTVAGNTEQRNYFIKLELSDAKL